MKRILSLCIFSFFIINSVFCQNWFALGKGVYGENGQAPFVYDILCDTIHHILFAGGSYSTAGDSASPNLAVWNGHQWQPFRESGFGETVYSLNINGDTLAVGGQADKIYFFKVVSADSIDYLFEAGDFDNWVQSIIRFDNTYVAGGYFSQASGQYVHGIAMWDGNSWIPMAHGFMGGFPTVFDMTIYNGELIAAGSFEKAWGTGITLNNIARWDGSNWEPLGDGLTHSNPNAAYVKSIEVYNGELYVKGNFEFINGTDSANHFAKWDGNSWSTVGDNQPCGISDMQAYNNKLYMAGYVGNSNGLNYWDGQTMHAIGPSDPASIQALEIFNDTLYFGGSMNFVVTNGDTAVNIAGLDLKSIPTSSQYLSSASGLNIYPNPATDQITIVTELIGSSSIEIRNALGRLVVQKGMNQKSNQLDIGELPAGIYLVSVVADEKRWVGKVMKY